MARLYEIASGVYTNGEGSLAVMLKKSFYQLKHTIVLFSILLAYASCEKHNMANPGKLVPHTVNQKTASFLFPNRV